MRRYLLGVVLALGFAAPASAGMVAVANFTSKAISVSLQEPGQKPRTIAIDSMEVSRIQVTGPCDITFTTTGGKSTLRLDPYHAYVLVPDEKAGVRLEGVEMPGKPPERDARPELNPPPRESLKIPVTLLVDDADPRSDEGWQKAIRARFETAAAVVEKHSGVRFTVAGFARWRSDPKLKDLPGLLIDFEKKVEVKGGQLAIGFTSRKIEDNPKDPGPFGAARSFPTRHIVIREWKPEADSEKIEVLIHHLGLALGASLTPDEGSVMRPEIANGLARHVDYRYRFDPLNVLAMSIWGEELRQGPIGTPGEATAANRLRLTRVYQAMVKARPGDSLALGYLNEFDRRMAQEPKAAPEVEPKKPGPAPARPAEQASPRDDVARAVIGAVAERARANAGPHALRGDRLATAYVKAAAEAALAHTGLPPESPERNSGFLIGLAVALDDTDALRNDPYTAEAVKSLEAEADREVRLAVIGNPTICGRRDLCRRFAIGCGTGELLTTRRAEELAMNRSLGPDEAKRPAGISLTALAAEFGGIALAGSTSDDPEFLKKIAIDFDASRCLQGTEGLRDGLTAERFKHDYGDPQDPRFRKVLDDIRERIKKAVGSK